MSITKGISFLSAFDFGNRNVNNPGANILSTPALASGDFDKANLTTESLRHVTRTADASGWKNFVIQAELSSQVNTIGILGHNFSSAAIIQVQANTSDLWTAPPVTITVPWVKKNIVSVSDLGATYEYYRVRVLDPSNPCGYVQIGRIVGGRALIMEDNEDITDDVTISEKDMADVTVTEGYFRASNENVKVKTLKASFRKLNNTTGENANLLGLLDMFDNVGITKPFLTILERANPSELSIWGQLDSIPTRKKTINEFTSLPISISEVF